MTRLIKFIETHHPNYFHSEDVARWNDLDAWLAGENHEVIKSKDDPKLPMHSIDIYKEFTQLTDKLFAEAFENYTNTK